ncbi:MAG: hypothetical protein H6Q89_912 [Myxococcaceae bacterium]|nr:hypothetical protein [Myxococcaceae bacterium]
MFSRVKLGHGVGLRTKHYAQFLEERPEVGWVEAISENFMGIGGRPLAVLEKVRRDRPVVLHGVGLSIGAVAPFDPTYLRDWKELIGRIEPAMVSDHLCWGAHGGRYVHDLLPMPFTEEALEHTVRRVEQVQELLGRQILIENVSSYLTYPSSTISEWDFLSQLARRADCGILLDVNNIYVSARNHGFSADDYLEGVPVDRVAQYHLAGHWDRGDLLIDTHEGHVSDPVWALYRKAVRRFGEVPTLIEWDEGVPELEVLLAESAKAAQVERDARAEQRP